MYSQVDEETLLEFADGSRVPSMYIENISLSVVGVSHPVRAVVVIFVIDGRTVVVDASASPQRESSKDITRISATQLKKAFSRQKPVYMVHLCQI
jgi:hypothetical protein